MPNTNPFEPDPAWETAPTPPPVFFPNPHLGAIPPLTGPVTMAPNQQAATPQDLGNAGQFVNVIWNPGEPQEELGNDYAAYIKRYRQEQMKQSTPATPADPSVKMWWHELDKYPASSRDPDTKADKRVCVVTGAHGKTRRWLYHKPYWMLAENEYAFCTFMVVTPSGEWIPRYKPDGSTAAGSIYREEYGRTIEWLKANDHVELWPKRYGSNQWMPAQATFKFFSEQTNQEAYAPLMDRERYAECFVLQRLQHTAEMIRFGMIAADGSIEWKCVSQAGSRRLKLGVCQQCSNAFQSHQMVPNPEDTSQRVCPSCRSKIMEKQVIRHYDDSHFLPPMPDKFTVKRKHGEAFKDVEYTERRMFGVEVELGFNTGVRYDNAVDVWQTIGKDFCYIKHDGSITKEELPGHTKMGFEVVSAPAGINVHRMRWHVFPKCAAYKTFRAWDTGTCGFHVHVSRDALTAFQIGRMLVFMNHANNRYFIDVVAGRSEGQYNRFIKKEFTDCDTRDESKYTALRTNKERTIEFRIFRGTINPKHILRNIEFCDAVCDYCAPCAHSLRDMMDFRQFIRFVAVHRQRWPLLAEWLASIDLIAKKKLSRDDKHFKHTVEEGLSEKVKKQLATVMAVHRSTESIEKALEKAPRHKAAKPFSDEDDDTF